MKPKKLSNIPSPRITNPYFRVLENIFEPRTDFAMSGFCVSSDAVDMNCDPPRKPRLWGDAGTPAGSRLSDASGQIRRPPLNPLPTPTGKRPLPPSCGRAWQLRAPPSARRNAAAKRLETQRRFCMSAPSSWITLNPARFLLRCVRGCGCRSVNDFCTEDLHTHTRTQRNRHSTKWPHTLTHIHRDNRNPPK